MGASERTGSQVATYRSLEKEAFLAYPYWLVGKMERLLDSLTKEVVD